MRPLFNLANLLEKSAIAQPSKIAIEDVFDNVITYQELNSTSEKIKKLLQQNGINIGSRVGILTPKSINTIEFIFAILKAGSAYVPLDSNAPITRNRFICENCELQAIFIEKKKLIDFINNTQFKETVNEITVNGEFSLLIFKEKKQLHNEPLAYIIYTSGSTGTPKGVKHTHDSAYVFIKWSIDTFSPKSDDRFLSYAPFHFDLSIFDIYVSISSNATLVLSDEKMAANPMLFAQCLSKKQISVLYATPSALTYLGTHGKMEKYTYQNLWLILFAGEVFPINQLRNLKSKLPSVEFYNLYGPTETNVCTWFKIPNVITDDIKEPFPIGKICDYAQYKIVTAEESKNLGELLIAGRSLMNGYWNDVEKTKTTIEIDSDGKHWYHTGDIAWLNDEGNLVYLRRKDRMVKRNGYRIELNEIENNLAANKNIAEVAVTAKSINSQLDTIITAHIVWAKNSSLSALDLTTYCHTVLPGYMVPDNFKYYEQLPKTSTHKINYNQLALL